MSFLFNYAVMRQHIKSTTGGAYRKPNDIWLIIMLIIVIAMTVAFFWLTVDFISLLEEPKKPQHRIEYQLPREGVV